MRAGVQDPLSAVLRPDPNASGRSWVFLGSGHGPLGHLVLEPTMASRLCRLLALVAHWGGRLPKAPPVLMLVLARFVGYLP